LKVSKDEKRDILTSNYYIIGINVFICSFITDKDPEINLCVGTKCNIILAELNILCPDIVIVRYTMILQILKLDLTEMDSETPLYKIATAIKNSNFTTCPMCSLSLYRPNEGNKTDSEMHVDIDNDMGSEACEEESEGDGVRQAKIKKENPDTVEGSSGFNPKLHFKTACYFACEHLFCAECVWKIEMAYLGSLKCPTCEKYLNSKTPYKLMYAPLPNLVLVECDVSTSITKLQQSKAIAWRDSPIYFYVSCPSPYWRRFKKTQQADYDTSSPIRVIFV
ncbi:hypothetical protein NEHOM01_2508, partial [Nematocida homosporus]|uniref:uncharacterized protein n=1 Tax=Nematocida homosporus TaxID=1912981 RepID=UPI0022211D05